MRFQDKPETKIGEYGEKIVNDYWMTNGYRVYRPVTESAHLLDSFIIPPDYLGMIGQDTKTKPAMNCYPRTGFEYKHYNIYKALQTQHRFPFFISFVDPACARCYGNWLDRLECVNAGAVESEWSDTILFSLESMRYLFSLPDECTTFWLEHTRTNWLPDPVFHRQRFEDLIGIHGQYQPHLDIPVIA